MLSDLEQWKIPPESRRIAHPQKIYLKFSNSDRYIEEYLVDLSMTGMFVRCLNPAPPGTILEFRMRLVAGGKNVEGKATVVWVRNEQQRLSHPKGVGVRFLELSDESRTQIRETIERYAQDPESPEEMNTLRSVVEETLGEVLGPEIREGSGPWKEMKRPDPPEAAPLAELPKPVTLPSSASKARPAPPPRRGAVEEGRAASIPERKILWIPLAAVAGALVLLLLGLVLRDRLATGGASPQEEVSSAGEAGVEAPVETEEEAPEPPDRAELREEAGELGEGVGIEAPSSVISSSTEPLPLSQQEVLRNQVHAWALAWSSKDVDAYLSFYARNFSPVRGLSGPQWRRQRRERISKPRYINVEIRNLQVDLLDAGMARTRFTQLYRSETLDDSVSKILTWENRSGEWKITAERVSVG